MSDIECPYCGAEDDDCVSDLWEFEGDDNEAECGSCGKEIVINAEVSVIYEAKRPECQDDNHEYGKWVRFDVDHKALTRWKNDPVMKRLGKENPYSWFSRDCKHCDDVDYSVNYELGAELEQHEIKSRFKDK